MSAPSTKLEFTGNYNRIQKKDEFEAYNDQFIQKYKTHCSWAKDDNNSRVNRSYQDCQSSIIVTTLMGLSFAGVTYLSSFFSNRKVTILCAAFAVGGVLWKIGTAVASIVQLKNLQKRVNEDNQTTENRRKCLETISEALINHKHQKTAWETALTNMEQLTPFQESGCVLLVPELKEANQDNWDKIYTSCMAWALLNKTLSDITSNKCNDVAQIKNAMQRVIALFNQNPVIQCQIQQELAFCKSVQDLSNDQSNIADQITKIFRDVEKKFPKINSNFCS